jgi:uncharacterized protein (DUF608 family)
MKTHNFSAIILTLPATLSLWAAAAADPPESKWDPQKTMEELRSNDPAKSNVVKKFPAGFPEALVSRGQPIVYDKQNSGNFEFIGMPVGGIGAGQLYLGGDGHLWWWDIFNTRSASRATGEAAYAHPVGRSADGVYHKIDQGFMIRTQQGGQVVTKILNREGIEHIEFLGQYPIGEVTYRDPGLPVEVKLEAFSPFIPLDLESSMLPATILRFKAHNISSSPVEVQLVGWLENAVLIESRRKGAQGVLINRMASGTDGLLRLESLASERNTQAPRADSGTMALTLLPGSGTSRGVTQRGAGEGGKEAQVELTATTGLTGELTRTLSLAPGKSEEAVFVLTWHFPKTRVPRFSKHEYAAKFADAFAVSNFVAEKIGFLTQQTRLWRDNWYHSTLPYWFLDRTFLNTSILASSTVALNEDGRFHGWEGYHQGHGTCTHVWGYVLAMGRLFPELEMRLREKTDFVPVAQGGAMLDNGTIHFRAWNSGLAVDGQAGIILRSYLVHQQSADDAFLRRNYAHIKKAMTGLTEARDTDHDGILAGPQHNTLDADWYGTVTWLSLHYQAALRAMAAMAVEMGDAEYARFCQGTADQGRAYIEKNLFNGEYFFHQGDPDHAASPGVYTGCEYSQLLGQSWAYQVGLGRIIDPVKTKTALESLWKYNFTTDVGPFREVHKGGRWYAMPGEAGLIACTWPQGGSEVLTKGNPRFAAYNNECQNGYEYALSSLMMWHGMPYHSLAHLWYMHNDRYHGLKRNPWCEVEWGMHYARSMASYGHFTAVCGFDYHGPKGYLAFAPKITPEDFKAPFVAAEGWGSYSQKIAGPKMTAEITLMSGRLRLQTLGLDIPHGQTLKHAQVLIGDRQIKAGLKQTGARIILELEQTLNMQAGEKVQIALACGLEG